MSMVHCKECGRQIHESATSCPGCGAPQITATRPVNSDNNAFFYFIDAWKNSFNYKGRLRRSAFWFYILFYFIFYIVISIVDAVLNAGGALVAIYTIASIFPNISTGIRRMHDIGRSGWWILLPIVNLIFFVQDSKPEINEYGPSPKYSFA